MVFILRAVVECGAGGVVTFSGDQISRWLEVHYNVEVFCIECQNVESIVTVFVSDWPPDVLSVLTFLEKQISISIYASKMRT